MTGAPARKPGLRDVFTQPGYRRLWAARTVSQWGDVVNTVALALLIFDLTGSGLGSAAWSPPRLPRCYCWPRSPGH